MTSKTLLVELLTEELPPKLLKRLGESFAEGLRAGLASRGLVASHTSVTPHATPRRLAVQISAVRSVGDDKQLSVRLLPESIAYDGGLPTAQLESACIKKTGFGSLSVAQSMGTLVTREEGGKRYVFHEMLASGQILARALQESLEETLAALPKVKEMTYQSADGWTSVAFVRPAHRLVALLDAGRETLGHRFEAHVEPVLLQDAAHYAQQMLTQGSVITSFDDRRNEIRRQLQHAASLVGLVPIADEALLDEVTALVEKPKVLACSFDEVFLEVPPECLVLTMKANQKYFPLLDDAGGLTNRFLVVSNIDPANPARIVEGNERVVRPRLADAKFFFDKDRKTTLESRLPMLDKVVYHAKLGSMGERVARIRAIARAIGSMLGGEALAAQADRAAQLAKADLVTDMVGEFPELQGTMGQYYARHDGEGDAVAQAIEDHYKPRFAGDALPRGDAGICVALADKLETLVGLFAAGEKPSGDKDPFALRRHALGAIRMLVERDLPLAVPQLIDAAAKSLPPGSADAPGAAGDAMAFVYDRLVVWLRDLGHTVQEVDAVVSLRPPRWAELPRRLAAVKAFAALPESASLAAANKRVANILKKSEAAPTGHDVKVELLREAAEQELHASLARVQPVADALFDRGDYTASLRELAALKAPVDAFFDSVMVNADDAALRANRLALLARLHATMNRVADLSKLAV
jgi:glycyl-tRNA synthetase beta chain